jgi:hypothetical protein
MTANEKNRQATGNGVPHRHWRSALAVLLCLTGSVSGCASLRLNGCSKLKACGELAVYACADSIICADIDGNTVRSEPTWPQRNYCRVCQTE